MTMSASWVARGRPWKLLATEPVSVQLRYLQTLTEIGVEKNTTVVFPVPVDFFSGLQKLLAPAPAKTGS